MHPFGSALHGLSAWVVGTCVVTWIPASIPMIWDARLLRVYGGGHEIGRDAMLVPADRPLPPVLVSGMFDNFPYPHVNVT